VNLFLCTRFASKTQDLAYVVQDRGANVSIKFWNADESRWIGDTLRGKDVATLVPAPADFVAPAGAVEAIATQTGDTVSAVTNRFGTGGAAQAHFFGSDK
jgi:hypothetical protein